MLMIAWVLFVADFVKKLVHERELRLHEVSVHTCYSRVNADEEVFMSTFYLFTTCFQSHSHICTSFSDVQTFKRGSETAQKLSLVFYIHFFPTVHEDDGRQPTQPLLRLVPRMRCPTPDHHLHPHSDTEVRQNPAQQRWLPPVPVPLWLWFERPRLQLPGQLLLWQDVHRRLEWQPSLHPVLLPLHYGRSPGDKPHLFSEEHTGEELFYRIFKRFKHMFLCKWYKKTGYM